jgi:hypothetical protein
VKETSIKKDEVSFEKFAEKTNNQRSVDESVLNQVSCMMTKMFVHLEKMEEKKDEVLKVLLQEIREKRNSSEFLPNLIKMITTFIGFQ